MGFTLTVPYPPSVNSLWRAGRGRVYRSKKYVDWQDLCFLELSKQECPKTFTVPVSVELSVGRPDNRKRDLDNLIKPVFDILQKAEILEDDSLVHRILSFWSTDHQNIQIEIFPVANQ